jgi:hypothetical protein
LPVCWCWERAHAGQQKSLDRPPMNATVLE